MSIKLTATAAEQLKELLAQEIEKKTVGPDAGLRVMVVGGGCSGFSYKLGFDNNTKENDFSFEVEGVKVLVDENSLQFVRGTEIDFHDGLMGRGFTFNNPNATGSCGCGSSFSA